ncbi:MAG TPA: hypothetical protein PLV25_06530, partial [Opitutales bacterium]|nr:hypothetical protein [Opitutales bacterium]
MAHSLEDIWVDVRREPARCATLPFDPILAIIDKLAELSKQSTQQIPSWLAANEVPMLALCESLKKPARAVDFEQPSSVAPPVTARAPLVMPTGSSHSVSL